MASSDSGSESVHRAEKELKGTPSAQRRLLRATHLSERKGKKKKDKIADVSNHAETQPQTVNGARKKRKTEDPETPVEAGPVSSNPEGEGRKKRKHDREGEEPPSGDKKKKRRKKEKTSGAINSPLEAVDAVEAIGEKRRKKPKASDPPPCTIEPPPSIGTADKPEKSRKRKPTKDDPNGDEESSPKPRTKSKRRKKGETIEDEEHLSTTVPAGDHSSRKRKKSKESVHPDPSDDPNLTEQSQKGLHLSHIPSESQNTNHSFDRGSSDLHLLPIHFT